MIYADPEELLIVTDPADALFDPRAELPLREHDVRNVARHGIIEAVVGRRRGDVVVVVDGRQRVRWAREVNKQLRERGAEPIRVPVMLRAAEDDADVIEVATSANEIRQDDALFARARKAVRLQKLGRSLSDIAVAFGVTTAAVQCWLRLFELHPEVQAAVEQERVRMSDALWQIGPLPFDKQPEALRDLEQARPTAKARGGRRKPDPGAYLGKGKLWRLGALTKFAAANPEALPGPFVTVLLWVLKEATNRELLEAFPALKPLVDGEGLGDQKGRRRVLRQRHAALKATATTGGNGAAPPGSPATTAVC